MNGQQELVGAGGIGLVAANVWTTQRSALAGMFASGAAPEDVARAHTALRDVGIELLFVGGATLLAGLNSPTGNAMVAMVVVLWVLFLMRDVPNGGGGVTGATGRLFPTKSNRNAH